MCGYCVFSLGILSGVRCKVKSQRSTTGKKLETRLDMTKQRLDHGLGLCILTRGSGPL